jgi:hypothetical protein
VGGERAKWPLGTTSGAILRWPGEQARRLWTSVRTWVRPPQVLTDPAWGH